MGGNLQVLDEDLSEISQKLHLSEWWLETLVTSTNRMKDPSITTHIQLRDTCNRVKRTSSIRGSN